MRPRIALATYDRAPALAPDDQLLLPALKERGIDGEAVVWSDDSVVWETFDGIVIRSCWDYHLRAADFARWIDRLDASRLPVWNSPALVTWNSHKRYLLDLARRGVPTIPTVVLPKGRGAELPSIVARERWSRFVLKPAISASGYDTHSLALPLDTAAAAVIDRVTAAGDTLIQPFAQEISRDGEYSLMFIDGVFSHAAVKRAAPAEFRVQTEHGGSVTGTLVSDSMIEQAQAVIRALPETPLYARVDGIEREHAFLLMELELIEPNLFLDLAPNSAARFAEALVERLRDA